jgi:hypothetical protein
MDDRDPMSIGVNLIQATDDANVTARLLGGVAIALHSPTARLPAFQRKYDDVDIVTDKRGRRKIDDVLAAAGFEPDVQFNNLHGLERRIYHSEELGKLDVFIGEFSMCHTLSFDGRLEADHPTVALADLFLTKAQIYELNRKDALDILAILADHSLGTGDEDTVNVVRITDVCGKDWGMWRTVNKTLDAVEHIARTEPEMEMCRDTLVSRLVDLREEIDKAPKSAKWKMRNKVGERKAWYELPEDPDRHPAVA